MLKFVVGMIAGMAMAFGYVRWDIELPIFLQLPDQLKGNIISTATEVDLYDLDRSPEARRRALEVFFANRPKFATAVDAEFGHPFLNALYRKRVIREARQLRQLWTAFDVALAKPALREALVKKHGTDETIPLKQTMLLEHFRQKEFIARWVEKNQKPANKEQLMSTLIELSRLP